MLHVSHVVYDVFYRLDILRIFDLSHFYATNFIFKACYKSLFFMFQNVIK